MTSPMSAVAVTVRPPAPTPCSARQAISVVIEPARPDRADPMMKITMLTWNTPLAAEQVAQLAGQHRRRPAAADAKIFCYAGSRAGQPGLKGWM
jgi:hypothetical protein